MSRCSFGEGLRNLQGDPDCMTDEVLELYGRPIAESGNAKARLAMMRMVPDGPDHPSAATQRQTESYVESLNVPAESDRSSFSIGSPVAMKRRPSRFASGAQ